MKFSVKVVDDENTPISGCNAKSIVFKQHVAGEGFGRNKYDITLIMTNEEGIAHFAVDAVSSRVAYGVETPEGYYKTYEGEHYFKNSKLGVWQPENENFKIVLKRIKKPIPMYAKSVGMDHKVKIPELEKPMGFDLIKSDWVKPHGKGEVADLNFHLSLQDRGRRDYDATLTVTFTNEGDGFIGIKAPFENGKGSQLVMPYEAPENGYQKKLVKSTHAKLGTPTIMGYDKTQHYFLRVRTALDEKGNIVSALYGKIQGDINFWNNKVLRFTYYLNPTPNDRNIEFDPKKNLIDTGRRGHKVQNP